MYNRLQWGHDFSAVEMDLGMMTCASNGRSFNGATTFQPWKCQGQGTAESGTALRFNGATTFQPWKYRTELLHRMQPHCFNGATTFQPWKFRGRASCWHAPGELQWGHDFSAVEIPRECQLYRSPESRFNGATTFQPWKCRHDHPAIPHSIWLQWGHDFSAVEMHYYALAYIMKT